MQITEMSGVEELETLPIERDCKEKKVDKKTYTKFGIFIKRFVDICGASVGIIFLIPITFVLFVIKIFSKNKNEIFYSQSRIGKNGKEFKLYKYQTMIPGADEELFKYLEKNSEAREEYKKYKKLKEDPRVTKIGKILRKTSLDEFPQFINVLKGEMSLVGPRPYLLREKDDMGENYNKIITVKPGITGYWQVNGRSDVDFEERMQMELYYIENRNIAMDVKILFKTILKMFKKNGAI